MDFIKNFYEEHRIIFWVATYVVVAGIVMLANIMLEGRNPK